MIHRRPNAASDNRTDGLPPKCMGQKSDSRIGAAQRAYFRYPRFQGALPRYAMHGRVPADAAPFPAAGVGNSGRSSRSRPFAVLLALLALGLPSPGPGARAQERTGQSETTLERAGDIASQPARDVGVAKTKIPSVLLAAAENPYAPPSGRGCAAIRADMAALNEALGPDFGADEQENESRAGKIAEAGGKMVVNSLIPFRGLVREVTGAAPAERRLQAAIGAGIARRGYLRGLGTARKCPLPD